LVVGRDVRADQPELAVADVGVRTLQAGAPLPEGLHLGAREHDAGLEPLEQLVLVPRPPVLSDELLTVPRHVVDCRNSGASRTRRLVAATLPNRIRAGVRASPPSRGGDWLHPPPTAETTPDRRT